jgi:hypothetical protein
MTMIDVSKVREAVKKRIEAEGYAIHPGRSRVNNPASMADLISLVATKLEAQGYGSQQNVEEAMVHSAKSLCAAWRGKDEMSTLIMDRYMATGPSHYDDSHAPEGGQGCTGEMGTDDTGHDGEDHNIDGQGQGQGQDQGQDTGSDDADGTGDDGDHGQGAGSGGEGEDADGDAEPTPSPTPAPGPMPDPVPPIDEEDMPVTDGYEPPSIWLKCVTVLRWNHAHPGQGKNILLVGPAGIGKTRMIFELSKKFFDKAPYMITAPQMDFRINGYNDAMGREVKTPVTKGYTDQEGGIIGIDEFDRMDAGAGMALQMATANKFMDTPSGLIEQAPLVTFIATANTSGTGATNDFNTANQLDKATRDRWVVLLMEWDHKVAIKVAKGDEALVKGLEDWNNACDEAQYTAGLVSYRTITDILDLLDMGCFSFDEAIQAAMLKYAIPKSNLVPIYDLMKDKYNKVAKAIKHIADAMPDNDALF